MRRTAGTALALVLAAQAATIAAAEAPPRPQCRSSGDVVVVSRDRAGEVGQDIYVTKREKTGSACLYRPKPGDLRIGRGVDTYVMALLGPMLALDSGTGPDRRLTIYDVTTRKKLADTAYDDARKVVADTVALTYWRVAAKPVAPAACPAAWRAAAENADARQAHRSYEVRIGLGDRKPHDTGAADCVRLQEDM